MHKGQVKWEWLILWVREAESLWRTGKLPDDSNWPDIWARQRTPLCAALLDGLQRGRLLRKDGPYPIPETEIVQLRRDCKGSYVGMARIRLVDVPERPDLLGVVRADQKTFEVPAITGEFDLIGIPAILEALGECRAAHEEQAAQRKRFNRMLRDGKLEQYLRSAAIQKAGREWVGSSMKIEKQRSSHNTTKPRL